jgi:hypothetical protein
LFKQTSLRRIVVENTIKIYRKVVDDLSEHTNPPSFLLLGNQQVHLKIIEKWIQILSYIDDIQTHEMSTNCWVASNVSDEPQEAHLSSQKFI